jgi:hypothetical protein
MRKGMIIFAAILALAAVGQAQISITARDVPRTVGQQFRYFAQSDSIYVNIGNPGGPQTWDFTTGDTSFIGTDLYLNPAQSPPQFSRANVVIQTDQMNLFGFTDPGILYCGLGTSRFLLIGIATTFQGAPVEVPFLPYIQQYPLPLRMGRTWSNPVSVDQQFSYAGDTYRLVLNATINSEVDAYGTVNVPLGSYESLRIKNAVNYDATIYIWLLFVWVPVYEQSGTTYNYDWRAATVGTALGITTNSAAQGVTYINGLRRLMGTSNLDAGGLPVAMLPTAEPESFDILSSYPNPFNGQTTIQYNLNEATEVDLRIFDLIGRQVAQLEEGYQEAGTHEIGWQPGDLSAGLYFVRLKMGSQMRQQVMIYLK